MTESSLLSKVITLFILKEEAISILPLISRDDFTDLKDCWDTEININKDRHWLFISANIIYIRNIMHSQFSLMRLKTNNKYQNVNTTKSFGNFIITEKSNSYFI